ncbi:hypothetical protein HY522_10365 [bacterium]|nr:hypothetical protein [bacterium]
MKTAISIPDGVFRSADRVARELRLSRSELYAQAVAYFIEAYRRRNVTAALNRVYSKTESAVEDGWSRMQDEAAGAEGWRPAP